MEELKQYSVFDDLEEGKHLASGHSMNHLIYYVFAGYFFIKIFLKWGYFVAVRNLAIAQSEPVHIQVVHPHFISALSITVVVLASIVLFCRGSLRASIALLILAALFEPVMHYFLKN